MGFEPGSTNISVRGRTDGHTDRWKERRMSNRVEGRLLFVANVVVHKDINAIPISSVVDTLFFDLATTSRRVVSIVCYFKTKPTTTSTTQIQILK